MKYECLIIGAGPGGYVAAVRSAQQGLKTAIVDANTLLGGTCTRVGCIPSKALIHGSELASRGEFDTIRQSILKSVDENGRGVSYLLSQNGVDVYEGWAKLVSSGAVQVENKDGTITIEAARLVLAPGSVPIIPSFVEKDDSVVLDSIGAIYQDVAPDALTILGAGYIGVELAFAFARLGSQVSVVEAGSQVLPNADEDVSRAVRRVLAGAGVTTTVGSRVTRAYPSNGTGIVEAQRKDGEETTFGSSIVVCAMGRAPATANIGLEVVGVETLEDGSIEVDNNFQTSVPGIFAIGDAVQGHQLAHRASDDAERMVASWFQPIDAFDGAAAIPSVIYTDPEVARVGMTEAELRGAGVEYHKGTYTMRATPRARIEQANVGFVSVMLSASRERLLGAKIVAPHAGEMAAYLSLAITEDIAPAKLVRRSVFPHPSFSEVIREALFAGLGAPLHSA